MSPRRVKDKLAAVLQGGPAKSKGGKARKGRKRAKQPDAKPNMLVTGVSRYWGERLALATERSSEFGQIYGIDTEKPRVNFRRTEFTHLDIRSPMILDFLVSRDIETVIHLQFEDTNDLEVLFQRNVLDFMFLLSACADAGVRNVVIMSETAVYGFKPDNPARLRESRYLVKKNSPYLDRSIGQIPHLANLLEIEKFVYRFREKHPEMKVTPLRFAPILGPRCNTWMTRYLNEPVIPTALGFDPMVQVIHEDDVVQAMLHAAQADVDGPVNIAAEGNITLHQIIRRMGKTSVPFARPFAKMWDRVRRTFTGDVPAPLGRDSLKFSCVGDLSRMKDELCFRPRMSANQTLDHFSEHRRMARYYHESEPEALYGKYVEDALKQVLADDSLGMGEH